MALFFSSSPGHTEQWSTEVLAISLTILILITSPILLILAGLVLLHRGIVSRIAKWADPSLVALLAPASAVHAPENVHANPSCLVISAQYLAGNLDEVNLIETLQERVFSKPELYPELKQKLVAKFGFQFWKDVDCFRVENHVRSHSNQVQMSTKLVMELMGQLLGAPFPPDRSPWEFILIPNFQDESKPKVGSVLIFRGHHCLVDGIAIHSLLSKLCTVPPVYPNAPKPPKIPLMSRICLFLGDIVCLPYELVKMRLYPHRNYWTRKVVHSPKYKYKVGDFDISSMELLKSIRNRYKIGLTCLINTLFITGFVRLAKSKGRMVPRGQITLPMFLPGHPGKLTNHYTACILPVEFYNGDTLKLMRSLDSTLKSLRRLPRSTQLRCYPLLEYINGSLPYSLMIQPENIPASTFEVSNMQGPALKADLCGHPLEEISVAIKPTVNFGFMCLAQSYNGSFKYSVYGDETLFEEDGDLEVYLEGMKEALEQLSRDSNSNSNYEDEDIRKRN